IALRVLLRWLLEATHAGGGSADMRTGYALMQQRTVSQTSSTRAGQSHANRQNAKADRIDRAQRSRHRIGRMLIRPVTTANGQDDSSSSRF
ncbi:MAG TPA: hypothetical protein VLB27_04650, partial [candidate division Zixibacteria bacterium]|nr:hypothetical protein [candidate division Zixibacteria bacterium]